MRTDPLSAPPGHRPRAPGAPLGAFGLIALLAAAALGVWASRRDQAGPALADPTARHPGQPDAAAARAGRIAVPLLADARAAAEEKFPRPAEPGAAPGERRDIRRLSQHFLDPGRGTKPWVFVPEGNIKGLSLRENPGLVTVWEAGKGKDVKGVLEAPIRLDDYPPPWEFVIGLFM